MVCALVIGEAGEYQPATVEAKELPSDGEQPVENDHGWLRTRGGRYGKYYDSRSGCLAEGDYATYPDLVPAIAEIALLKILDFDPRHFAFHFGSFGGPLNVERCVYTYPFCWNG